MLALLWSWMGRLLLWMEVDKVASSPPSIIAYATHPPLTRVHGNRPAIHGIRRVSTVEQRGRPDHGSCARTNVRGLVSHSRGSNGSSDAVPLRDLVRHVAHVLLVTMSSSLAAMPNG